MKIQLKHCKRALTKGHPASSLSQRGGRWLEDDIEVAKLVLRLALLSFISSETLAWDGERIHPLYEIESSLHIKIPQIKTHSTSKSKATSPIHQTESQTSLHIEIPKSKSQNRNPKLTPLASVRLSSGPLQNLSSPNRNPKLNPKLICFILNTSFICHYLLK